MISFKEKLHALFHSPALQALKANVIQPITHEIHIQLFIQNFHMPFNGAKLYNLTDYFHA